MWVFTEVIPSTLTWFADNWQRIFIDVGNFLATVIENMAKNAWQFGKNLPGLLTGQVDPANLWTPITDGFKATVQELPEIAKRQQSETSKALGKVASKMQDELGQDFKKFAQKEMENAMEGAEGIRQTFEGLNFKMPEVPSVPSLGEPGGAAGGPGAGGAGGGRQREGFEAVELSRQFMGIAGRFKAGMEPAQATAKHTSQTVEELKKVNRKLEGPPRAEERRGVRQQQRRQGLPLNLNA